MAWIRISKVPLASCSLIVLFCSGMAFQENFDPVFCRLQQYLKIRCLQIYGVYVENKKETHMPALEASMKAAAETELAEEVLDEHDCFRVLHEHTHIAMANVLRLNDGPDPDDRAAKALVLLRNGIKSLKSRGLFVNTEEWHENDAGLAMR